MLTPRARLRSARVLAALLLCLGLASTACDRKSASEAANAAASAAPIGLAECAACGMVVREQPAPRGQVVHRDGTRVFLCSIGDLVQYLQAPSPHGAATEVFVEVLEPDADPARVDVGERAWVPAASASFVVGITRKGVMGRPVLAYRSQADAAKALALPGAEPKTWANLSQWVLGR